MGLVLVDSAHENQRHRLPSNAIKELTILKLLASVLRMIAPFGISRVLRLADRMQGATFAEDIRPAAVARMNQAHFPKALFNEVRAVEMNTTQGKSPADLGKLPLVVLSRGGPNPGLPEGKFEQLKKSWGDLQQDLVKLSKNNQHVIAKENGHYIHHDQPELVVEVIRQVVESSLRHWRQ
jgi:hypothetical protein